MKREQAFALAGAAFIFAALYFYYCTPSWRRNILLIFGIMLVIALIVMFLLRKHYKTNAARITGVIGLLLFSASMAGFASNIQYDRIERPLLVLAGETHFYRIKVKSINNTSYSTEIYGNLISVDGGKFTSQGVIVAASGNISAKAGDTIALYAELEAIPRDKPSSYNPAGGYIAHLTPTENLLIIPNEGFSILRTAQTVRNWSQSVFEKYMGGDKTAYSLATGMFLGDRSLITHSLKKIFARTGTSHLLAVSGLHLTVLTGFLYSLLRFFSSKRQINCAVMILAIAGYVILTGFSPSAVRAGIMLTVYYLITLAGLRYSAMSSLTISGVLICLMNVNTAANAGFLLSYCATAGIIFAGPVLSKLGGKFNGKYVIHRILRTVVSTAGCTVAATLATLPITTVTFGGIATMSVFANLIISFLAEMILVMSPVMLAFSWIPAICGGVGMVIRTCAWLTERILQFISEWKFSYIAAKHNWMWITVFVIFTAAAVIFTLTGKQRRGRIAATGMFALGVTVFIISAVCLNTGNARQVTSYHVNHESGTIIFFRDNFVQADVVEISHGGTSRAYSIVSALEQAGTYSIGSLVIADLGSSVLEEIALLLQKIPIDQIYLPESVRNGDRASVRHEISSLAKNAGCDIIYFADYLQLADTALKITTLANSGGTQTCAEFSRGGIDGIYLSQGELDLFGDILKSRYDIIIFGVYGKIPARSKQGNIKSIVSDRGCYVASYLRGGDNFSPPSYIPRDTIYYMAKSNAKCVTLDYDDYMSFALNRQGAIEYRKFY